MPYCPGCGSRYQEDDRVCKSCGMELNPDTLPTTKAKVQSNTSRQTAKPRRKKKPNSSRKAKFTADNQSVKASPVPAVPGETEKVINTIEAAETRATAEPPSTEELLEKRHLQAEMVTHLPGLYEIHLGKGIIKPKAVEVGLDGFHFKYESPNPTFEKGEMIINEQVAELRVVNPEFATEAAGGPAKVSAVDERPESSSPMVDLTILVPSVDAVVKPEDFRTAPTKCTEVRTEEEFTEERLSDAGLEMVALDSLEVELKDLGEVWDQLQKAETELTNEINLETVTPKRCSEEAMSGGTESGRLPNGNELACDSSPSVMTPEVDPDGADSREIGEVSTSLQAEASDSSPSESAPVIVDDATKLRRQSTTSDQSHLGLDTTDLNLLWQGQQSWYGIPLPYYYRLYGKSLVCTDPNGHSTEYQLTAVIKVTMKQSWLGRLLGIGDLVLDFANLIPSRFVLIGIANPARLRVILENLLSKAV
jgi:hypothetical protein